MRLRFPSLLGRGQGWVEKVGLDARPFLYSLQLDGLASLAPTPRPLPSREGSSVQNAALTENITWLPAMLDPSLVDEKFGSR